MLTVLSLHERGYAEGMRRVLRSLLAFWCGAGWVLVCLLACGAAEAQQADADRLFGSAMEAQQRGDFPAAIRDYQKLLQLEPKLTDARVNLGAALAHVGRFDEAIAQYRLALDAMPQNAEIRMNLGLAFYKKGDLPDAIREFDQVQKEQPTNVQLAILLGDSEVRSGQAAAAAAMLQPLEAANAGNMDFEFVLGTALVGSGKRRDGVARLQQVADATHAADAYFLAGSTLLYLHESAAARKDLDQALQLNPKLPRVAALAGIARDRCGDPQDAEVAFRQAIQGNPKDPDANLYLGAILLKRRELAAAKPFLDVAVQVDPKSTMARYESALWDSYSGQYASAATNLEAVIKVDPTWLDPHVELATVYYKLHRPEDGAKQREIVAKLTEEQQRKGPGQ